MGRLCKWLALILVMGIYVSCDENKSRDSKIKEEDSKEIVVEVNKNLITSHIIEHMIWEGSYPSRPMVLEGKSRFNKFRDHPAIKLSDSLLINEIFYFDELTTFLLYIDDFPGVTFKYPLQGTLYEAKQELIEKWLALISEFYVDSQIENFIIDNQDYYNGCIKEVRKNLPPKDFVYQLESYYRTKRLSYTLVPSPEMQTGGEYGYRGIGPYIKQGDNFHIYNVISASQPVYTDSLKYQHKYGFDDSKNITRMSYHEFGHAFVNPIFEEDSLMLQSAMESSHLLQGKYKEIMQNQNYGDWITVVCEYLVRLGEIRLAERSGNEKWAADLRDYHIRQLNYVLLPELEMEILKFESSNEFDSFADFLPNLLDVFKRFELQDIEHRISS
ncbi:MAG: DUF4932 domain-containing protein [Bacteroidota bacterium]